MRMYGILVKARHNVAVEEHITPEETPAASVARWQSEVGALFDKIKQRGVQIYKAVGKVPVQADVAGRILLATGADVAGFTHVMDSNGVAHILKHHAHLGEPARGQVPIARADFLEVVHLLLAPDTVEDGGPTRDRLVTVRYSKAMSGHTFYYVECVRPGKRRMTPMTLYKRRQ